MKVILLDGTPAEIETQPSKYPMRSEDSCRSKIQYKVGQLLRTKFPFDPILEDVPLPLGLYIDFFLPKRRLAVEVQGIQHNEFVGHFHKNQRGFINSKDRDSRKAEFCRINNIKLITCDNYEDLNGKL